MWVAIFIAMIVVGALLAVSTLLYPAREGDFAWRRYALGFALFVIGVLGLVCQNAADLSGGGPYDGEPGGINPAWFM
jgi:hypothetical protein